MRVQRSPGALARGGANRAMAHCYAVWSMVRPLGEPRRLPGTSRKHQIGEERASPRPRRRPPQSISERRGPGVRLMHREVGMFTGIVEEIGVIREARPGTLVIGAAEVISDLKLGDSVAVDGVCLTVVDRTDRAFTVNVQPETLRRTTLGSLAVGTRVNLERAVAVGGRLGGHVVQGHVDATGRIVETRPDGDGLIVRFQAPRSLMRYIVQKGFIAVNGISLTVVETGEDWFTVALVRYTRDHVALLDRGVGSTVNLEVDVLAKYVERLLLERVPEGGLTLEMLSDAGFA